MHVRMVEQGLAPGMQDRQKADLGPEVFRVSRNRAQGLGGGAEQNGLPSNIRTKTLIAYEKTMNFQ